MKLKYFGHSCFSMTFSDGTVLVTDPFDASVTYPPCTIACNAALVSHDHFDHNYVDSLTPPFEVIRESGSYTVGKVKVTAMKSFHDKEKGALRGENLLMKVEGDGLTIVHMGDLGHMPTKEQAAFLSGADVLLIPIGGKFTIDTAEAEEIIRAAKPKMAVAMHFQTEEYGADNFVTPDQFIADMNAVQLGREIELTGANISDMPAAAILAHK